MTPQLCGPPIRSPALPQRPKAMGQRTSGPGQATRPGQAYLRPHLPFWPLPGMPPPEPSAFSYYVTRARARMQLSRRPVSPGCSFWGSRWENRWRSWVTTKPLNRSSMHVHSCPLCPQSWHFCCAPYTAQLSRCQKSSPPPLSCSRAFAPLPSAPVGSPLDAATHMNLAAAEAQQVLACGSWVSISVFPKGSSCKLHRGDRRGRSPAQSLDQGGRGCSTGCGRGRGGGGAGIWVARSRASCDGPQEAGGKEATESSPGTECGGFPGSTPRAATEHAQSPSRPHGAGEGARKSGGKGLNLRTLLLRQRAGSRLHWQSLIAPGSAPERSRGLEDGEHRKTVYGIPKESWNKKARCTPRSLPRELFRGPSLFFSLAPTSAISPSGSPNPDIHPSPAFLCLGTSPAGMPGQSPPFPTTGLVGSSSQRASS